MADLLLKAPLKYEPLRKNRWFLRFPDDIGIQVWALKSAAKPKMTITAVEMDFMNTKTYVSGKYHWNAIPIIIRDFIAPSQSQALMEWVRLHAESVTGRMGYNVGAAKNVTIEMVDPTGVVVQKWTCRNCILTGEVDFGALDYSEDGVTELSFSIQPQDCILNF